MSNITLPDPLIDYDVDVSALLYGEDSIPEDLDSLEWM